MGGAVATKVLEGERTFDLVVKMIPRSVASIDGIRRIRFTSPHPIGYRDDLIEAFRRLPKLCSHIHLPLHQQALNWAAKKNIQVVQLPDNGMPWKYIVVKP